ncbi:hypothetical protein PPACK8108_LOCUS23466 [Phakopsora pachyrhizi]|uniref:DUF7872 domain-containing protein n=1 Tax=Phakopsora pachyrhizi TaxID=170000 RepID=A0AAV0BML8_PHAPC|nr:hypothetical protein PPACK8108_LOCUS23466 [Phakopsora pachyrhizi]
MSPKKGHASSWLIFVTFFSIILQCLTIPSSLNRRNPFFGGNTFSFNVPVVPDPSKGIANPCKNLNPTPELWRKLDVDQYIADYPGLSNMNITAFAASLGMQNFFCGIGMTCLAGQLCYPLVGMNWMIFMAVQEWNNYMNIMYIAIENAISIIRGSLFGWEVATIVCSVLTAIAGAAFFVFRPVVLSTKLIRGYRAAEIASTGEEAYTAAQAARNAGRISELHALQRARSDSIILNTMDKNILPMSEKANKLPDAKINPRLNENAADIFSTGKSGVLKRSLEKRSGAKANAYAYNQLQSALAASSDIILSSPFYSNQGLAAYVGEGTFSHPGPSLVEIQKKAKALALLSAVGDFFRTDDPCTDKGENGAWAGNEVVSWCTPTGTMLNLIRAEGIHARNTFPNAYLLKKKYGYTSKFLLTKADECQKTYGMFPDDK